MLNWILIREILNSYFMVDGLESEVNIIVILNEYDLVYCEGENVNLKS